jgi:hypothetical protein
MEEKYYLVRAEINKLWLELLQYHGLSFVKLSGNKLENIAGNDIVSKKVAEIKEGELIINNRKASVDYEIQPMDKAQFEFHLNQYKKRLENEK